ncbi:uncharacterized protein ALTATR162_LOCUS8557 [Alternaria atra]|uniref:Uncharacterized protein n=1 Tax=Alternaria atra TaxID=119953 RepID=A0A8J2I798_9PLEO|nr:uncharacterized protein ALTATR162_LOCUS8557 [Alternaria atra]CAG5178150.1 unnamed protein product [Alternaria atra]
MSTSVFAVSFSPAIAQALGIESDPNCIPLEIFFAIPTYLVASLFYPMNRIYDSGSSDWSFGQVIPLVLLAALLLTIFEPFFEAEQSTNTLSTALLQISTT